MPLSLVNSREDELVTTSSNFTRHESFTEMAVFQIVAVSELAF